ncbi:MAG: hypothetical protein MJZ68_05410 [archaeon]|nr:hypothetical protein [archaeon]
MSFLDNPTNAGTAFLVIGIVTMILGLVSVVLGVIDDAHTLTESIIGVGSIIGGFLYFAFGKNIREGNPSDKWGILTTFVKIVGIVAIIAGVFSMIAIIDSGMDAIAAGVISIIVGLIILFVYSKMVDGQATTFDKIIWILLLVIFVFGLIGGITEIISFNILSILTGLCDVIIYLFMIVAILDDDVKKKMGM